MVLQWFLINCMLIYVYVCVGAGAGWLSMNWGLRVSTVAVISRYLVTCFNAWIYWQTSTFRADIYYIYIYIWHTLYTRYIHTYITYLPNQTKPNHTITLHYITLHYIHYILYIICPGMSFTWTSHMVGSSQMFTSWKTPAPGTPPGDPRKTTCRASPRTLRRETDGRSRDGWHQWLLVGGLEHENVVDGRFNGIWWGYDRIDPTIMGYIYIYAGWWFGTWMDYDCPYIGNNYPNWRSHIFQRGWYTTNQLTSMTELWLSSYGDMVHRYGVVLKLWYLRIIQH